jgi:hypothetical protein
MSAWPLTGIRFSVVDHPNGADPLVLDYQDEADRVSSDGVLWGRDDKILCRLIS